MTDEPQIDLHSHEGPNLTQNNFAFNITAIYPTLLFFLLIMMKLCQYCQDIENEENIRDRIQQASKRQYQNSTLCNNKSDLICWKNLVESQSQDKIVVDDGFVLEMEDMDGAFQGASSSLRTKVATVDETPAAKQGRLAAINLRDRSETS